MIIVFVALAMIVLFTMILRLGLLIIRLFKLRYALYSAAADEFYSAANRLIDNEESTDEVLQFIGDLNATINFQHSAVMFIKAKSQRLRKKGSAQPDVEKAKFDLRELPQSVVADFAIAINSWIVAVSNRSMIWGPIFRLYLDIPSVEKTAPSVTDRIHHGQIPSTT